MTLLWSKEPDPDASFVSTSTTDGDTCRNNATSCALRVWGITSVNCVASASAVLRLAYADASMVGARIGDFCATPGIESSELGIDRGSCALVAWYGAKLASNTTAKNCFRRLTLLVANKCMPYLPIAKFTCIISAAVISEDHQRTVPALIRIK
jgi:hypothetical protein